MNGIGKLEYVPLNKQVADNLRKSIMDGELKDGQRLPLAMLEEAFQISRTPIKEGLMMLENDGLVHHEKNKDFTVVGMTDPYINDYFDLRIVFENAAIRIACKEKKPIDVLEALQDQVESDNKDNAIPPATYAIYGKKFHMELWKLSGNTRMLSFLDFLSEGPSVEMYKDPHPHWALSIQEHRALLEALETYDAEKAQQINKDHLNRCREELLQSWHAFQKRQEADERKG